MPPQEFMVRGFAPPTPNAIHALSRSADEPSKLFVQSMLRPQGTPSLKEEPPKELPIDDHAGLIDELEGILKEIPMEDPPGSQDIYGMDTSIMYGSEGLEWQNGGPAGCGGGQSEVQATPEQKAKFKRAVEIVTELTKK